MPNKRRLNLQRYGISENRYDELKAFCRQYPEWQQKIREARELSGIAQNEGISSGKVGNQTEQAALRALKYMDKVDAVHRAMRAAVGNNEVLFVPMLRSVTEGVRYENLNIAMSRTSYFEMRTAFFVNLDKLV